MTFKELLVEQADNYEVNIDITEDMEQIKTAMAMCPYKRSFTINLIQTRGVIAVGREEGGAISLFVPAGYSPLAYRQKFIDALLELGFAEEDITITQKYCKKGYNLYSIYVKW